MAGKRIAHIFRQRKIANCVNELFKCEEIGSGYGVKLDSSGLLAGVRAYVPLNE